MKTTPLKTFVSFHKSWRLAVLALGTLLANSGFGATLLWNGGGGANTNWNNAANWFGVGIPANGDSVIFQGTTSLTNFNNIAGLTLNQIKFNTGGFFLRGNDFTLTNSLIATNTSLVNTLEFTNITLATSDVLMTVSNGVTLTMICQLIGSVGVTKTGAGTLAYTSQGGNTYAGSTRVNGGILTLRDQNVDQAFGGPLVIGDGSVTAATVRLLFGAEIPNGVTITINRNGVLDLNNQTETIGTSLTLNDNGSITTGTGTLTLLSGATVTANLGALIFGNASISGKLNVGSGNCNLVVNNVLGTILDVSAVVSGSATINKSGNGYLSLDSANIFSGQMNVLGGTLGVSDPFALGTTNSMTTVSNTAALQIYNSVTNESLIIASTGLGIINASGANVWAGTNLTLSAATTFEIDGTSLDVQAPITGTGGYTKTGAGTLRMVGNATNSYGGTTTVNVGLLELSRSSFDGSVPGDLVIGAGATVQTLASSQISNASTVTMAQNSVLDLGTFIEALGSVNMTGASIIGTGTLLNLLGTLTVNVSGITSTISKDMLVSATRIFNVANSPFPALTISGSISGVGGITKTGTGNLNLTGANTYTGLTTIQQGWLEIQNAASLGSTNSGTVVSNGATLYFGQGNFGVTNEALTLNGTGNSGWGALDSEASNGTNYWTGPITLNADSHFAPFVSTCRLSVTGPISGSGGLIETNGSGTLALEGSAANTYGGTTTANSGTLLLNKPINNQTIPGNLVINGTVRLANNEQIANSADVLVNGGGLFDFVTYYEYVDTLHGVGTVNFGAGGWIDVGVNDGSSTFDGLFTGIGYALGFTVGNQGNGTFTMNGNNTFTNGAYHVFSPGKLLMNGSSPQVPVIVDSGATFGGSGTVGTILANGAISPGNSPGSLTSSNVTFTASGSLNLDIYGNTAGTDYDQLNVRGTNTLANAALNINLSPTNDPVSIGQTFTLINNDGFDSFTGIFSGKPEGAVISQNGYKGTLSYGGGSGNDLTLTITSVPGAALSATVTSGNGSHTLDPNECNSLNLVVTNTSGLLMPGISATLSTTTPGVIITQPYSTYANIAAGGKGTNSTPFQISTLPTFVCGTTINLQLIVNAGSGDFITSFTLPSGGVAAAPLRFNNNVSTAIPDIGSIDSTNVVSAFSGPLEKVTVSLYLTHTFDSDLNLSLISPDGTTVSLVAATGAGANFGSSSVDANRTTFDDASVMPISAGAPPFVGTFRPQGSLTNFNFNATPNGNWKLHITDSFGGSLGTLRNWSLLLYPVACNDGGGNCDYCLTFITNAITPSDPIMTNRISRNYNEASCGSPKSWPGFFFDGTHHYDFYSFTNTSGADACVSVVLTSSGCDLQAGVYTNYFDPSNVATNYVADSGSSTLNDVLGGPQTCSVEIPAGAKFTVCVNEIGTTAACGSGYTLQLSGLPCPVPTLVIVPTAPTNSVRLHWPTWAGGYNLESITALTRTNWAAVTNEPLVNLERFNVTNTMNPTNTFYRLKKP